METDKNIEELAKIILNWHNEGLNYVGIDHTAMEIISYYASKVSSLEEELKTVHEKIDRIEQKYIRKNPTDEKEFQDRAAGFNSALDRVLEELNPRFIIERDAAMHSKKYY